MGYLARKLSDSTVENEVLALMPGDFVQAYEELCNRALVLLSSRDYTQALEQGGGQKGQGNAGRRNGQHSEAKGGGKRYTLSKDSIRDERFFEVKQRVDRRLRRLVEDELRLVIKADRAERIGTRCTKCGKYGAAEWAYCPWDGERL